MIALSAAYSGVDHPSLEWGRPPIELEATIVSALAWLSVPIVATLGAIAWTRWASRPRRPEGVVESVENYRRLRAAMDPASSAVRRRGRRQPPVP